MNRYHCNVNGLLNGTVKTQVKNVLSDLDGVKKVNVDLRRGSIEVDYNNSTNENEIRGQIEHVGCRIE
jgi:copper chaperone CopZ